MQEEAGAEGRTWQRQHLDALHLVVTIFIILVAVNVRLAINASKKHLAIFRSTMSMRLQDVCRITVPIASSGTRQYIRRKSPRLRRTSR